MWNKDLDRLVELMKGQTTLYGELLRLAGRLNEFLDSKKGPDELLPVISEREELFEKIKAGDSAISEFLSKPGRDKLLAKDEPKSLIEELKRLIKKVMEADSLSEDKLGSAQDAVQAEFRKVMKTKKDMGGYGSDRKPVYAKFIDLRH